jgi:hypothetical protein
MEMNCQTCKYEIPFTSDTCIQCVTDWGKNGIRCNKWEPKEKEEKEMAVETKIYTHEKMVEALKKCGQSIIENAESIVGHEQYVREIRVTVSLNPTEAATINVDRDFYPEGIIK